MWSLFFISVTNKHLLKITFLILFSIFSGTTENSKTNYETNVYIKKKVMRNKLSQNVLKSDNLSTFKVAHCSEYHFLTIFINQAKRSITFTFGSTALFLNTKYTIVLFIFFTEESMHKTPFVAVELKLTHCHRHSEYFSQKIVNINHTES